MKLPFPGLATSTAQKQNHRFLLDYVWDMLLTLLLDGIHILTKIYKTSRMLRKWDWRQSFLMSERGTICQRLRHCTTCWEDQLKHIKKVILKTNQFRNSPLSLLLVYRSFILPSWTQFPQFLWSWSCCFITLKAKVPVVSLIKCCLVNKANSNRKRSTYGEYLHVPGIAHGITCYNLYI